MSDSIEQLQKIISIMAKLRDPATGCPWDVKQDFASIAPYTIEEAYEVADAIESGNRAALCDELGDLLLQVVFHARIAEEEGSFSLADVARSVSNKMINRHPHVFGDDSKLDAAQQRQQWEEIKQAERAAKGQNGVLDGIPAGLPPMQRALKLQKRAAGVGFDWPDIGQLIDKMHEEAAELTAELKATPRDNQRITDEVGDLLFVAVNLARKAGVDPETALIGCNKKFENRFNYIEQSINKKQKSIDNCDLEEMEQIWQEAKTARR
jgi:MazG family protein